MTLAPADFLWALESLARLHRVPVDATLARAAVSAAVRARDALRAGASLGLRFHPVTVDAASVDRLAFPCLAFTRAGRRARGRPRLAGDPRRGRGRPPALLQRRQRLAPHGRRSRTGRASSRAAPSSSPARRSPARRRRRGAGGGAQALRLPLVRARARPPPLDLARRARRLARDPARRARDAALHPGGHRQGGRAPHPEHARRHRARARPLPRLRHGDDLGAPVPRAPHRQPHRRGARRAGLQAPLLAAGAVLRAAADRHADRPAAGDRVDPRVPDRRGGGGAARPAVHRDLPRGDVLVQLAAQPDRGRAARAGHRAERRW